jgi:hypothetical protein
MVTPEPVAVMRRRFPGLVFWYGAATGHWWALVSSAFGWRLVEARDVEELTRAVVQRDTWPCPSSVVGLACWMP